MTMQRRPMWRRVAGIVHSRILPTLVLAFLLVSQGGAAHQIRGYTPVGGAAYPHVEPIRGQGAQAAYDEECLHCHAPMGCLASHVCADCHPELGRSQARAVTEEPDSMPPEPGTYEISRVEEPGPDHGAFDVAPAVLNHEQLSGFSLERHETGFDGAPLGCESCHPQGLYDSDSVECAGCHTQEAPAYMADHVAEHGDGCRDCHDGQGGAAHLEEAGEVHPLGSAHAKAGCQDCHTGSTFAEGVRACSDCHEEPEAHAGATGLRCDWCHTAVSWADARLMEHSFRLDHGGLDEASCDACHTGTYESYTCSGCHDHQSAELQERHAQEGIDRLEACGQCHPTGVQGEAGRLGHGNTGQPGSPEPEAPGPDTGGQQGPANGQEIEPPGQEGGEQIGTTEQVEGMTEPGTGLEASEGTTEPAEGLPASGGAVEAPVEGTMAEPAGSLPAPAVPSNPGEGLEPGIAPAGPAAED